MLTASTSGTVVKLDPSATYATRAAGIDQGHLVIWTARHESGPVTVRRYKLEEIPPDRIGCRAWLLTKADGKDYVTVTGGMPSCDCDAGKKGKARGDCVHLDGLTALIREGHL